MYFCEEVKTIIVLKKFLYNQENYLNGDTLPS